MNAIKTFHAYIQNFNANELQALLISNIDIVGYIITFYIVFIVKGPQFLQWLFPNNNNNNNKTKTANGHSSVRKQTIKESILNHCILLYHFSMMLLALIICLQIIPIWVQFIFSDGLYETICIWNNNLILTGPVAFWAGVYTLSRVFALLDIIFIILFQNSISFIHNNNNNNNNNNNMFKRIPFYSWYYQVMILAYFWHTYSLGMSYFVIFIILDALSQFIISLCKLQMNLARINNNKNKNSEIQTSNNNNKNNNYYNNNIIIIINITYILEYISAILVAIYAIYMNYNAKRGCAIMQANGRMCVVLFISCLYYLVWDIYEELKEIKSENNNNNKKRN